VGLFHLGLDGAFLSLCSISMGNNLIIIIINKNKKSLLGSITPLAVSETVFGFVDTSMIMMNQRTNKRMGNDILDSVDEKNKISFFLSHHL
jgi:hypothetical protein